MLALGLVVTTPVTAVVLEPISQGFVASSHFTFAIFTAVTCLPLEYLVLRALLPEVSIRQLLPRFLRVQVVSYLAMYLIPQCLGVAFLGILYLLNLAPGEEMNGFAWLIVFLFGGMYTNQIVPLLFEPWALRGLAVESHYSIRRVRYSVIVANLVSFFAGFGAIAFLGEYRDIPYDFMWWR